MRASGNHRRAQRVLSTTCGIHMFRCPPTPKLLPGEGSGMRELLQRFQRFKIPYFSKASSESSSGEIFSAGLKPNLLSFPVSRRLILA